MKEENCKDKIEIARAKKDIAVSLVGLFCLVVGLLSYIMFIEKVFLFLMLILIFCFSLSGK